MRAAAAGRRCLAALALLGVAAGLSACGGGSKNSDVDPDALLDRAFSHRIPSSQTQADFRLETEGVPQLEAGPVEVAFDGPYISGKGKEIPSVDWSLDVTAGGLTVNGRAVSTGDDAFVQFLGSTYEVGTVPVAQANQDIAAIHPRPWFTDPDYVGDEEVDGVQTHHVKAELNRAAVVGDLGGVANELGVTEDGIGDSSIEVWVGADDEIIRQLDLSADFTISPSRRDTVGGLTGGDLSLDVLESDVGEPQTVNAPRGPYKPISELLSKLPPIPGLSGGPNGG